MTSFGDALSPPVCAVDKDKDIRLAFIGNSMIYFNDSPRLVENMLRSTGYDVRQDSCLRGGATLSSLWERGNGMKDCFRSKAALIQSTNEIPKYDIGSPTVESLIKGMEVSSNRRRPGRNILIVNDHTQSPARIGSRDASATALMENFLPCINNNLQDPVLVLFLQTPAYRLEKIRGTEDLGSFDEFTNRTREGYGFYSDVVQQETGLQNSLSIECQVAPVGEAFRCVRHQNRKLWEKLYSYDDFHPSLHGTWLQACILYALITKQAPPLYQEIWWQSSRYLVDQLPFPTSLEAEELRQVARDICQISLSSSL
jgi:hypothetical protein